MDQEFGECALCNELYDAWSEAWSHKDDQTESSSDVDSKKVTEELNSSFGNN